MISFSNLTISPFFFKSIFLDCLFFFFFFTEDFWCESESFGFLTRFLMPSLSTLISLDDFWLVITVLYLAWIPTFAPLVSLILLIPMAFLSFSSSLLSSSKSHSSDFSSDLLEDLCSLIYDLTALLPYRLPLLIETDDTFDESI